MTSVGVDSIYSQVVDFIVWLGKDSANANLVELLVALRRDKGWATASALLNKIATVKSTVRTYGYARPATTAEIASSYITNPFLCTSSPLDIAGINTPS